ncbi:hypothetical protein LRAMOSA06409 [Lichtheimia ramosa]|uniref:TM7S3/TM198-like domain-containing protein n=1 Tax=Lichtheimia ramosa TaxID=688394 RepID=A0A077X421_9FUNG|nr:hypothetical protein LRAMOSA06409 [Lichtheimia ramosa]
MGIIATLLMFIAVFLCSVSFRYFIITIAITGFLIGAMVTWMILTAAEPLGNGYPRASIVYSCGCFGAGIILAGVLMFYWRVGLYFLPAFAGYMLAIFIWCWKEDYILLNVYARQFTSVGFAVGGILLALVCEFVTVVLSTSFIGAYCFMFALDLIIHGGMVDGPRFMLDFRPRIQEKHLYHVTQKVYAMLGGILGLWVMSMIWQLAYNRGRRFGVNIVPKKD